MTGDDPFDEFEDFDDEPGDDDLFDPHDECGRWDQNAPGGMWPWSECRLAGSEFCSFECPYRNR